MTSKKNVLESRVQRSRVGGKYEYNALTRDPRLATHRHFYRRKRPGTAGWELVNHHFPTERTGFVEATSPYKFRQYHGSGSDVLPVDR